jgi:hypothetical protein
MTVTLRRVDPIEGAYEFYIPGDALISDWPERKVYDEVNRRRQQPWLAERFSARIRALSPNGETLELAGGEIAFPADASRVRPPASNGAPGAPGTMGAPPYGYPPGYPPPYGYPPAYGAPPAGYPYGYPPAYGYGAPPGALPGWLPGSPWGPPPPWYGQPQSAQPPAKVAADPELLAMWRTNQEIQASAAKDANTQARELTTRLLDLALERASTPPPEKEDGFATLERAINLVDKLRPPVEPQSPSRGITIHNVDGARIVENKDGDLDVGASGLLSIVGDAKAFLQSRAAAVKASSTPGIGASRPPPSRNASPAVLNPRGQNGTSNGTNGAH